MSPVAYILVGVPCSGKTTWCGHQNFDWGRTIIASTDNYIDRIAKQSNKTYNEVFHENMTDAIDYMMGAVKFGIEKGYDIIWDQTSTTVATRARKLRNIPDHYRKIAVVFKTPSTKVLEKRNTRPGKIIPWEVISDMAQKLEAEPPTLEEGFDEIRIAVGQGLDYELE